MGMESKGKDSAEEEHGMQIQGATLNSIQWSNLLDIKLRAKLKANQG